MMMNKNTMVVKIEHNSHCVISASDIQTTLNQHRFTSNCTVTPVDMSQYISRMKIEGVLKAARRRAALVGDVLSKNLPSYNIIEAARIVALDTVLTIKAELNMRVPERRCPECREVVKVCNTAGGVYCWECNCGARGGDKPSREKSLERREE